ncbi:MAG: MBL fold metallo-hydrolase [Verrucomicrobiae bacterium]|nr:MBL fold metallo-hydrolase [Verrucomicrobiae bacterium]
MSLEVTFLGTGTSQGCPLIGVEYPPEYLANPKNHRTRSSVWVRTEKISLVVDTSPEFRIQALREKIRHVDAVIITHAHADHMMGMDDLRRFCEMTGERIPIYASAQTMDIVKHVFFYAFGATHAPRGYFRPEEHVFESTVTLGDLTVTPLPVPHGKTTTFGLLFEHEGRKKFAYISDAKTIPDAVLEKLRGVEVMVLDALRKAEHPTHMSLPEAIDFARIINARKTYFTHLTHEYDHDRSQAELPEKMGLAWDGLKMDL